MQPVFENVAADFTVIRRQILMSWWLRKEKVTAFFAGIIQAFLRERYFPQSPRRLRAKYTHCTNFVYAMGISPLQGSKVTLA